LTMRSSATSVTDYLKTVPAERKVVLVKLRKFCVEHLKGFEETMEYEMPSYKRNDVVEVGFNSQKNFIALYILRKDVLDKYRNEMKGLSISKGCIRYSKSEKLNFEIIEKLLTATYQSKGIICG
jgi:uncharacterized protein YdhG (YjbR/CyaY superfamily)